MERGGGTVPTLPGSSIVKRDEKVPESEVRVIPDGAGAQTSFRDQLAGLDGLGLRLLLYENPPELKPKVLLSHNRTLSTPPGSNIVKRGESYLESQLPIIPYDTCGQTSCGVQLQSTDGHDLCPPLHESRLESKHKIFLSHSGAQKSFVKQLCKDIERYDRYPFFDVLRTSLPIGCDFPSAIFEAIGQCQVAVVVLSEDFFSRTKWPMLELSALVKRKSHDPDLIIMPVFLGLTREQCRERKNQDHWFSLWESWAKEDRRIVLEDWMAVFKVFGYTNSVSLSGSDEVKCREDIVDAVCCEVRAETRRDDSHVQGRMRMCKTIDEKIGGLELSKYYQVRVLGLYGVGGIGKSTACMTLCNHYFEEFQGRVCHVEFGVGDELYMLREILKRLTKIKHEHIKRLNLDECKHRMKDIKNQKILLAIDNVSESYEIVQKAKWILRAGFAKRSIVIVTARSLGELQNLNIKESECMEMPELSKDDATSLFVQEVACDGSTNEKLIHHCVDRCYFRKGDGSTSHYLPLALRVLGGQLGSDSKQWLEKLEEMDVFNQYRERHDKHPIFSILRRSFDILNDEDKFLFMDVVLFGSPYSLALAIKGFLYDWLSMVHGKQIISRLNGLKKKSLIQSLEEGATMIGIHDLWREFCIMETKVGESKSRRWIYDHWYISSDQGIEDIGIYSGAWKRVHRISLIWSRKRPCNMHLNLNRCSYLTTLHLEFVNMDGNVLDLNGAYNLKSLRIRINSSWEVHGLGSLRHLCLLEWSDIMPSNMAFIEEIGGLTNLQILNLSNPHDWVKMEFPNLGNLSLLQCVAIAGFCEGVFLYCNSTMTDLRHLFLHDLNSLQRCHGLCNLVQLEELNLCNCPNLEGLLNLQGLKKLKKLDILRCNSIQTLLGVGDLTTLLELRVYMCPNLVELSDLSKLKNLQALVLQECSINRAMMELSGLINLQECVISINGMEAISDLIKLTNLYSMKIEGWSPQASSSVDSLVNLEEFSILKCTGVDSLVGLSNLTRLRNIDLEDCEFKDVACLMELTGLREVSIVGCNFLKRFPDLRNATRLEKLRIFSCKNLQVLDGMSRARATSPEATRVDLQSSGQFSNLRYLCLIDLTIIELLDLSNFPHLERLSISCCQSLVKLISSVPLVGLKEFTISQCWNLIAIPNLSSCKDLQWISLWCCGVSLSENEIEHLKVLCPTMHISIL